MAIAENPDVGITLTGLLVFIFAPDKSSCQIGVISNPEHKLRIGVLKITPDPSVEPMPIGDFSAGDIRIEVINPITDGITLHTSDDFDGLESGDPNDFRWTPDLEGERFHGDKLPIKTDKIWQIIHLNNGLLFTRKIHPKRVQCILPGSATPRKQFISELVGINIDFKDKNSKLVFTYGPNGEGRLEMKNIPGQRYKIVIKNDRPGHDPDTGAVEESHDHAAPAEEPHDHAAPHDHDHPAPAPAPVELDFKFYYEVFDVPEDKRIKMFTEGGTDTIGHPCGTGSGGKTGSFS